MKSIFKEHINRIFIISLFCILALFTSCVLDVTDETYATVSSTDSSATGSSYSPDQEIWIDVSGKYGTSESEITHSISTTVVSPLGDNEEISYDTLSGSSTGVILINLQDVTKKTGVHLTGTMTTGGVKIQTSDDYETGVYLEDVSITSSLYPCLDLTKGGTATVFIEGTNSFTDGRVYSSDYSSTSDNKGTLFCKGGLALCDIDGTSGSATLSISQNYKSCIATKGNLLLESGTYTLTSTAVAVYDSSEKDFNSPTCLRADGNIVVTGGTVTGTASGNGSKGMKAGGTYTQSGGTINVSATGSVATSGSYSSSAKGVRITGAIVISGGTLYASSQSHEAIESKSTITISGGEVYGYSASDDGINASSDFTVSGGYVCGYAPENDGLDSNGNMYIQGGVVFAVCSTSPEVALDANTEGGYKLYITGGTIMTLGPLESGSTLTQTCYKASSWSANTTYGLTIGDTTYTFKTPSSTSGYGSGIVVSGSSRNTSISRLTSGATASSTTYFNGLVSVGGTVGNSSVALSPYSSSSSGTPGGISSGGPGNH